jgi:hypothetical protein
MKAEVSSGLVNNLPGASIAYCREKRVEGLSVAGCLLDLGGEGVGMGEKW